MTTTIMTRAVACPTEAANPTHGRTQLDELVMRMVREADVGIPAGRRARRTLQEMMPGYERQPVLVLHRPAMGNDACPLCGRWLCNPNGCPSVAPTSAPVTVTASGDGQCCMCGNWYPDWNGGVCESCN
ncbi:hypothetical protein [Streptomyces scabiei]|uniref:hypothetical protein n=1 Tax=Streptomyces scabiei TaxID=1930 RepID=UPI0029AAB64F|nr:hypothetical protein [Streptomyces scabiei]MDX2802312.1 hypothetical protein [Streptomyces scabiei]MDX3277251.1 hypothetical protein [Streptomyces scabiei]